MKDKEFWLATRGSIPCGSFKTRREAVKWLKGLLKQVLKDFDNQDKSDEFDYAIHLREIKIEVHTERKTFLGF